MINGEDLLIALLEPHLNNVVESDKISDGQYGPKVFGLSLSDTPPEPLSCPYLFSFSDGQLFVMEIKEK